MHRVRRGHGQHRVRRLLAAARDRPCDLQARPRLQDPRDRPVQPRPPDLLGAHGPRPQGRLHPGGHPRQRAHGHDRGDEPAQGPGQQLQAQPRDPRPGHARVHPDAQPGRRRALPARERPDVGRDGAALPAARRPPAGVLPRHAGTALLGRPARGGLRPQPRLQPGLQLRPAGRSPARQRRRPRAEPDARVKGLAGPLRLARARVPDGRRLRRPAQPGAVQQLRP